MNPPATSQRPMNGAEYNRARRVDKRSASTYVHIDIEMKFLAPAEFRQFFNDSGGFGLRNSKGHLTRSDPGVANRPIRQTGLLFSPLSQSIPYTDS